MSQVILHRGEKFITEDLKYYFSGERDKNNQIRPDKNIYSMTPESIELDCHLHHETVSNFFYPQLPNQLDRIYIGISVSLFANHWGASFLIELLKLLKPGGVIILPVYPEGQAGEKGYWSRSFLENIFLSRSLWSGLSNVNAENDGVMSLRVGKNWPKAHPSSIEWFYQERSNLLLADLQSKETDIDITDFLKSSFVSLSHLIWQEYTHSAIIERIIVDHLSAYPSSSRSTKEAVNITCIGRDYGLLINDLILSSFVEVQKGLSLHVGKFIPSIMDSVSAYFSPLTQGKHQVSVIQQYECLFTLHSKVIVLNGLFSEVGSEHYEQVLLDAWEFLDTDGLLIVFEDFSTLDEEGEERAKQIDFFDKKVGSLGDITYYSAIAACKIETHVEISQYSLAIEDALREEKKTKERVFRVVHKK